MKKLTALFFALIVFFAPVTAHAAEIYTVQSGDTLWKIAVKYRVGLSEIIEANPHIKNPDMIYPGQKINIPEFDAVRRLEHQVIELTNQKRVAHGLKPLRANWQLSRMARHKAWDMRDRGYFSHDSPTYGSPFQMMRSYRIGYSYAGENIAAGQPTPSEVVNGWMKSPGHRRNILDPNYTQIGVGFAKGGKYGYYWVQVFIKP